jgi:hypothetical protein
MDSVPAQQPVLVRHRTALGKWRVVKLEYVSPFAVESSDHEGSLELDYCEADDTYYWPEGWYECIEHWDNLTHVLVPADVELLGWTPLPDAEDNTPGGDQ